MRQAARVVAILSAVAGLAAVQPALAVGVGFYLNQEHGNVDWDVEGDYGADFDISGDTHHMGFGFVLDTSPGNERAFNYRLNFGFEKFDADFEWRFWDSDLGYVQVDDTLEMQGMTIDNTFGFAVFRGNTARVWMGPQIRLGFYYGESERTPWMDVNGLVRFGVSYVVGANFKVAPRFTIGATGGLTTSFYGGGLDNPFFDDSHGNLTGAGTSGFFHVSFLF